MTPASPAPDPAFRLAWLFDIDGTLLTTDGAAREAFALAVHSCLGVRDDLEDISFAGRTDPLILAQILARHGLTLDPAGRERFWLEVLARMAGVLHSNRGRLLPGVAELLDRVGREPQWAVGLLTGNTRRMADIKLGHFGVSQRFAFGAFGDEAPDRNALARVAVARAHALYGVRPAGCIVVGDTEHDIACARAAGAWAVAVATGVRSRAELAAHRPDLLLDDLVDTAPLLPLAARVAAGA